MNIGIFGGTFNPVHNGHLRSAEETREAMRLDKILFMPCCLPPHKGETNIASPDERLAMLELSIRNNPFFEITDVELKRGGKSYSIETLKELLNIYGKPHRLFFIIGMDSFVEIGLWKSYEELFSVTDFIVVARPGYMKSSNGKTPMDLLPVDIREEFCYYSQEKRLEHKSGRITQFLETTLLDISSTRLRQAVRENRSIRYLIPTAVRKYIHDKNLYRGTP